MSGVCYAALQIQPSRRPCSGWAASLSWYRCQQRAACMSNQHRSCLSSTVSIQGLHCWAVRGGSGAGGGISRVCGMLVKRACVRACVYSRSRNRNRSDRYFSVVEASLVDLPTPQCGAHTHLGAQGSSVFGMGARLPTQYLRVLPTEGCGSVRCGVLKGGGVYWTMLPAGGSMFGSPASVLYRLHGQRYCALWAGRA
jgi:hypothetical protein